MLVSLDVVNMFANIDYSSGLESAKNISIAHEFDTDSTQCIIKALEISFTCKKSKIIDQNFLKRDGTGQVPHMSCS